MRIGEWNLFQQALEHSINASQHYGLYSYQPLVCVAYHLTFATPDKGQKILFPRKSFEASQKLENSHRIIESWLSELTPTQRANTTMTALLLEILPRLIGLISPAVRPVALALLNTQERAALQAVVSTMVEYGVGFVQRKSVEGKYDYELDPPLTSLVVHHTTPTTPALSYIVKQVRADIKTVGSGVRQ